MKKLQFADWLQTSSLLRVNEDAPTINYLQRAAFKLKEIVGDNTLVILGRDAWVLVPLLRKLGVKTQYFLYSRLQYGDESTKKAWLREVPKGSYVLDTGYRGSIFDDIKKFDPSIHGILMSSDGMYPEIQVDGTDKYSRADTVGKIEAFPKIIGRSTGFKDDIAQVKRLKSSDHDIDSDGEKDVQSIVAGNEKALRDLGLPEEDVQKYKTFSGIPLHQRIGHTNYFQHYFDVDRSRHKDFDREMRKKERNKRLKEKRERRGTTYERMEDFIRKVAHGETRVELSREVWKKLTDSGYPMRRYKLDLRDEAQEQLERYETVMQSHKHELENSPHWDADRVNDANNKYRSAMLSAARLRRLLRMLNADLQRNLY